MTKYFDYGQPKAFVRPVVKMPVHATYTGGDNWETPGIDFSDYERMQTQRHNVPFSRRKTKAPDWAINDLALQEVIVRYMEARALISTGTGTMLERLNRASAALVARTPQMGATLDALCKQYVELKRTAEPDSDRLRRLEIEIENLDTQIRMNANCAGLIASIAYLNHRVGLDSIGIAQKLRLKPCHVRMVLYRLNLIAQRPPKPPAPPKPAQAPKVEPLVVFEMRGAGETWATISRELHVSRQTAMKHVRRIERETGVRCL